MSQDTMINERVDEGGEEGDGKRPEILSQRDEVLTLDRKEADMAHRQMEVYKGKGGTPCQDEVFHLNC